MTTTDVFTGHGGRLQAAMQAWPQAPTPWIDLSTGINPTSYPAPHAPRAARARLPFPEEVVALELEASRAFGIDDPACVLATPGAEAGLRLLPHVLKAEACWIERPTYAGHVDAWAQAGVALAEREEDGKAIVLVNPNNPDGRRHTRDRLLTRADGVAARGGWLIVDESFGDISSEPSIASAKHPQVVALRSFGKFYGLAGLRLGFVVAPPPLISKLRKRQGDWPISADAIAAGLAAYKDKTWATEMRARLKRDAGRLDGILSKAGLELVGGAPLFRLTTSNDAEDRFAALCAQGLLCRPFTDNRSWLRFGLPRPAHGGALKKR